MIWNKVSSLYDFFETIYNKKVYRGVGVEVGKFISMEDNVLECACGTGAISIAVAPKCKRLVATDFADGMLKQARRKLAQFENVMICKANIMKLDYADCSFDKVIAGNVIHLLDNPHAAVAELFRVCKSGGQVIIPTYINITKKGKQSFMVRCLEMIGVSFSRQFDLESYMAFFAQMGIKDVKYEVVEGRMPCAIAVIDVVH